MGGCGLMAAAVVVLARRGAVRLSEGRVNGGVWMFESGGAREVEGKVGKVTRSPGKRDDLDLCRADTASTSGTCLERWPVVRRMHLTRSRHNLG